MDREERVQAFVKLGQKLEEVVDSEAREWIVPAVAKNGWFTDESVRNSLQGIRYMLHLDKMDSWLSEYQLKPEVPKIVGIVMAGNIPLVGFHDLMCVLLSGHVAKIKLSTQDEHLMKMISSLLIEIEPRLQKSLIIADQLKSIDAVIATGSDNSARYFEYYFSRYPHIIRKNRTSVALITGEETVEELQNLGLDVFQYFGLGCRNVAKLLIPKGFTIATMLKLWEKYSETGNHHKYRNNYDYHKSIMLINKEQHLDNGFHLLKKEENLHSPLSVTYYQEYDSIQQALDYIEQEKEHIQCVVSKLERDEFVSPGKAQQPEPWDYADRFDTLQFLDRLN
jgi:hypothetical protein